eukprot:scaffold1122_cov377-Prasinococcus_capsulatus_cf.AAC.11
MPVALTRSSLAVRWMAEASPEHREIRCSTGCNQSSRCLARGRTITVALSLDLAAASVAGNPSGIVLVPGTVMRATKLSSPDRWPTRHSYATAARSSRSPAVRGGGSRQLGNDAVVERGVEVVLDVHVWVGVHPERRGLDLLDGACSPSRRREHRPRGGISSRATLLALTGRRVQVGKAVGAGVGDQLRAQHLLCLEEQLLAAGVELLRLVTGLHEGLHFLRSAAPAQARRGPQDQQGGGAVKRKSAPCARARARAHLLADVRAGGLLRALVLGGVGGAAAQAPDALLHLLGELDPALGEGGVVAPVERELPTTLLEGAAAPREEARWRLRARRRHRRNVAIHERLHKLRRVRLLLVEDVFQHEHGVLRLADVRRLYDDVARALALVLLHVLQLLLHLVDGELVRRGRLVAQRRLPQQLLRLAHVRGQELHRPVDPLPAVPLPGMDREQSVVRHREAASARKRAKLRGRQSQGGSQAPANPPARAGSTTYTRRHPPGMPDEAARTVGCCVASACVPARHRGAPSCMDAPHSLR